MTLKANSFLFTVALFLSLPSLAMSDKEICRMRGDLMHSIAIARDAGKTQKQVKKVLSDAFGQKLPSNTDIYIKLVYEESKGMNPEDVKTVTIYSCYKEFGLIK